MDLKGLRDALAPSGTLVTIGTSTLPAPFDDFLGKYYVDEGKQIQIDNVEVMLDEPGRAVKIAGRGHFQGAANLPVRAVFTLDDQGNVDAVITYTLLDGTGSMSAWKFSTSFPGLPVDDAPRSDGKPAIPLLDTLSLSEASFVVSTRGTTDPATKVALGAGIAFVGRMIPTGLLGVLDGVLAGSQAIPVYGSLRIPVDATDVPVPSLGKDLASTRTYPWELTPALPGIHLWAPLGKDLSLGKAKIRDTELRIFSPLSANWTSYDEVFAPLTAVTGQMDIPSAGIAVEVIATADTQAQSKSRAASVSAFVDARCQGLSIGNLAHLSDIAGPSDLAAGLPDSLGGMMKALGKLSLVDLALSLSAGPEGLRLSWASISIGAPGCRWRVWGDNVEVTDIGLRFDVLDPLGLGGSSQVTTSVWGTTVIEGVAVEVKASKVSGGFLLAGQLKGAQRLRLKQLMKSYLPGIPAPSDLTIDDLRVSINPSSMQLGGALAQEPEAWTLALGPGKLAISDVLFDFAVPRSGSVTGMFRGDIALGKDVKISMERAIPGSFVVKTVCKKVTLGSLLATLTNQKAFLPAGFDLTLLDSSILIEEQNASLRMQLATRIDGLGCLAFEAKNIGGMWGFAVGLDLGAGKASGLPGLSALAAFEKQLHLEKLALVVASYDNASFQFPDLAQFQNPAIGTGKVSLPAQSGGLHAGFNLFGEWRLDGSDKTQNLLAKLLGLEGTLGVTLQISPDTARMFVRRDAKIAGHRMSCQVGMMSSFGPGAIPTPSWFLTGSLTVNIQGTPQTFDVSMASVPTGAFLSATMKGSAPVDCKLFKLSNLALEIGVNWAGVPSLGIAATIDVKAFESSVAVFFDSTDPAKSLVAGSVSNLSLKDVANTLIGGIVPSSVDDALATVNVKGTHTFKIPGDLTDELDSRDLAKIAAAFASSGKVQVPSSSDQVLLCANKPGAAWHLTDLTKMRHYALVKRGSDIEVSVEAQFYFAPQRTMIGTIPFPQGYYLNGAIELAGFHASATIDIAANKGISVDAQMDKIVILDESVFSIAALSGGGGPKISISTFSQPDNPVAQFRQPHFYVNGALTMLGVKQGIYASVSVQGIEFELNGQLVPGVKFDLDARFGKSGLGAGGKVRVGVGTVDLGALGKAKINTDLEVEVDIDIDVGARTVRVAPGASYAAGATLLSNELVSLVFQGDGNLVLYKQTGGGATPLWASNTVGRGGSKVTFQGDGNLVMYTSGGAPVWASNTNGQGVKTLALQSDCNLVLYDDAGHAKWATNTAGGQASIELESSFDFAGQHVNLGRFKVEARADTFTSLPSIMSKKVEAALRDLFKDSTKWANAVKNGVVDGVNDTAKVFKDVYGKSEKEANDLANSIGKGTGQAVSTVENTAKDVGKTAEKTTKKVIKKVKFW